MKVAVAGVILFLLADVRVLAQVPAAPADLASICDATGPDFCTTGIETCRSTCAVAACCGAEDPAQNCLADNLQTCPSYIPCSSVLSNDCAGPVDGDNVVPDAPDDIATLCDNSAADFCTVGAAACGQACAPAGCCAATDGTNCAQSQLATCMGYAVCAVMTSCPPPLISPPPVTGGDVDGDTDGDQDDTDGDVDGDGDGGDTDGDADGDVDASMKTTDDASAQKVAGILLTVSLVTFLSTIL